MSAQRSYPNLPGGYRSPNTVGTVHPTVLQVDTPASVSVPRSNAGVAWPLGSMILALALAGGTQIALLQAEANLKSVEKQMAETAAALIHEQHAVHTATGARNALAAERALAGGQIRAEEVVYVDAPAPVGTILAKAN